VRTTDSYSTEMPYDVGFTGATTDAGLPTDTSSGSGRGLHLGSRTGFNLQTSGQGLYPNGGPLDNFSRGFSNGSDWSVLEGEKPISYSLGSGLRSGLGLVYDGLTGAEDFHQAGQAWGRGNYGTASLYGMRGVATAGLTALTLGDYALAKGGMSAVAGASISRSSSSTALDLTSQFSVQKGAGGLKLQYGDPQYWSVVDSSHGIVGFVDKQGILGIDVFANPSLRASRGSGTDMFNSLISRTTREGVELQGIRGAWISGTDSVNFMQYRAGISGGLSPEQAALNTWTGKLAQQHGFTTVEKVIDTGNVYSIFRKPVIR
jgi:hypothetical protein